MVREVAIVGQDQQPGARLVEPADGVDSFGNLGQQIDDASGARWVGVGRNVAFGLVDGIVHHRLEPDRLAVNRDPGLGGVDPSAKLADDLAVDGDPALEDELLAPAARAEAGMRQHFLEPIVLVRIGGSTVLEQARLRHGLVPWWAASSRGPGLGSAPDGALSQGAVPAFWAACLTGALPRGRSGVETLRLFHSRPAAAGLYGRPKSRRGFVNSS